MNSRKERMSYEPHEGGSDNRNSGGPVDTAHSLHPESQWQLSPPSHDFEIAIICALPLEASVVGALFDKRYDDKTCGKAPGDPNTYSTGVLGNHNVVLVHLPNMGKVAAATAAVSLRASFQGIQLALVVGICGGAPFGTQLGEDILLGDVVISEGLVQYDLGRQFPNNRFMRKDTARDNLPRPGHKIRAALAKLQTEQGRSWLQNKISENLSVLQRELSNVVSYPGVTEDKLFKSKYRHKHRVPSECLICANNDERDDVCDKAVKLSCQQLKCDDQKLVYRARSSQPSNPVVHFGLVASGDTVMKSGEDRDDIAARDDVIAFEMEGAGVWENFPGSLVIKGVCDYADSHKSKKWQGYAAATAAAVMKGFLENWSTDRARPLSPRLRTGELEKDSTRRAKEIEILKRLSTSPYRDRKDRNPDRINGTCEWFVAHELFRDWQESKSSRLLWVSADPGCGKSVLAKYLVDSILATTESKTICYFFFKDDFQDQRSIVSALCCILQQLYLQKRNLLSEAILERFEINGEKFTSSFGELWDALINAAKDKNAGEIICLFDAIDECEESGRSQLTQALCKLYSTDGNFNLKFLLTSRPYGEIRRGFQPLEIPGLPVIHLSGESEVEMEKISREIDLFIKARVQSIKAQLKLGYDEQELLLQGLMRVPNRTYLWVHLTLNLVESDVNIDKIGIVKVTSCLPKSVDEAYERILSKSHNFEEAKRLLHVIVAAARPLTLKEMSIALALKETSQSYGDLDLKSEDRFQENIRDLCGLFVTIIDTRIYLLHQTAKEFLVQSNPKIDSRIVQRDLKWKSSITLQESHRILLKICIWHLLFKEFEDHPANINEMLSQYVDSHVFLDYSAKYWTVHFHESHVKVYGVIQSLRRICDAGSSRCPTWFKIYWMSRHRDIPANFTNLMIASYFGLREVVKLLLQRDGIDLNSKDGTNGRSALSWAAGNGFHVTVALLIKGARSSLKGIIHLPFRKGAEVDSLDRYGRTPLSYAVWNGYVKIVKLLIKAGARVDLKDEIKGTPLSYAICNGNEAVVKQLLKRRTQVDSKDTIEKALLLSAAKMGHEAVVELLLEKGAYLETEENDGRTPLSWAAEKGYKAVVEMLVEKGADLEARDNDGSTPLMWSAKYGHRVVAKLLLEKGADLETRDNDDRTPLIWSTRHGHRAVVELLLEKGADLETKDNGGLTPLMWSAKYGRIAVIKLLLEKGADLETGDNDGRTALWWARSERYTAIEELLQEKGAKVLP